MGTITDVRLVAADMIEVDEVPEVKVTTAIYSLSYLLRLKQEIQDQKDRDNAARDVELLRIDNLLDSLAAAKVNAKVAIP